MHTRSRSKFAFGSLLFLLSAVTAFAQEYQNPASRAAAAGFMSTILIILFVSYIYIALAMKTIADKTNTENAWLAWIPIANIFLLLKIAGKPAWWFILFLIPLVNIIISVLVWMGVAEARQKPNWWGILMIVPVLNFIVPGYLAWSE